MVSPLAFAHVAYVPQRVPGGPSPPEFSPSGRLCPNCARDSAKAGEIDTIDGQAVLIRCKLRPLNPDWGIRLTDQPAASHRPRKKPSTLPVAA
jgi:hypothetical protein